MAKKNGSGGKPMLPVTRYLPCRAEPGMFRGELLVFLNAIDPTDHAKTIKVQMLVDTKEVDGLEGNPQRHKPVVGWVKVTLADQRDDLALVVLPQPAQPVGESMLVKVAELKEKPFP